MIKMTIASNLINSYYPHIPSPESVADLSGKLIDSSRFDHDTDKDFDVYQFPDLSELIICNGEVFSRAWKF